MESDKTKRKREYYKSFNDFEDELAKDKSREQKGKKARKNSIQNERRGKELDKRPKAPGKLFDGMVFYFFPPTHTVVRRFQIQAVKKRGAQCVDRLSKDVTHVIVDQFKAKNKPWSRKDLKEYLKLDNLPDAVYVNEKWTADCIDLHRIIDPSRDMYKIPEDDSSVNTAPVETQPPPKRKRKRKVKSPEADTQATESLPTDSNNSYQQQAPKDEGAPGSNADDLTKAIWQAKVEQNVEHMLSQDADGHPQTSKSDVKSGEKVEKSDDDDDDGDGKRPEWIKNFHCLDPKSYDEIANRPNAKVEAVLTMMLNHYEDIHDEWRALSYRKALASLKRQTKKIETAQEAKKLFGWGDRLAQKLEEIVKTNGLKQLEYAQNDNRASVMKLFQGIYGVGTHIAGQWYNQGLRTLDDVSKRNDLTDGQKIGLEHYKDFATRIPRAEVERHGKIVYNAMKLIDDKVQTFIMGSYRRGAKDCGDIDLVLTKEGASAKQLGDLLRNLISMLKSSGFLVAELVSSPRKWYGVSVLPNVGIWRRIDFLMVPWGELGGYMIYFTGDDIFNRSLRLLAQQKGYHLSNKGLFTRPVKDTNGKELSPGKLIEGHNERKIFEILGVPYRPPTERNCV